MSRREIALEEALKLRKTAKKEAAPDEGIKRDKGIRKEERQPVPHAFRTGEVVIDPAEANKHVVCLTDPHSHAAEQYKKIRARILKATAKEFLNTIMITSSDIDEGKTITAINLAITMSNELDHTVLLVDADLRNPSIHKYLGLEPGLGLSDYLLGRATVPDILVKTGIGKLVVIPGGGQPENPAELLSSERMRTLVRELKQRYDDRYVIFDSSPVLATADPLSLGGYMDGVILLVQAAQTPAKAVIRAASLLKDFKMLGVVLNNVPDYLAKSLYTYRYRYGKPGYAKA